MGIFLNSFPAVQEERGPRKTNQTKLSRSVTSKASWISKNLERDGATSTKETKESESLLRNTDVSGRNAPNESRDIGSSHPDQVAKQIPISSNLSPLISFNFGQPALYWEQVNGVQGTACPNFLTRKTFSCLENFETTIRKFGFEFINPGC